MIEVMRRLLWWLIGGKKNLPANAGDAGLTPGSGRSPGERNSKPTPVFLPGKSHGQRSLVGYSSWCHKRVGHDLVTKQQQKMMRASVVLMR